MLVEILVAFAIVFSASICCISCIAVGEKISENLQPYYVKCAVYKALEWVNGEIPGQVVLGIIEQKRVRIRAVRADQEKVLTIDFGRKLYNSRPDQLALILTPSDVIRAGTLETDCWSISFPPVVARINVRLKGW